LNLPELSCSGGIPWGRAKGSPFRHLEQGDWHESGTSANDLTVDAWDAQNVATG